MIEQFTSDIYVTVITESLAKTYSNTMYLYLTNKVDTYAITKILFNLDVVLVTYLDRLKEDGYVLNKQYIGLSKVDVLVTNPPTDVYKGVVHKAISPARLKSLICNELEKHKVTYTVQ